MGRGRKRRKNNVKVRELIGFLIFLVFVLISVYFNDASLDNATANNTNETITYSNIGDIPQYSDQIYVTINNNIPYFEESEYITEEFERYSNLDELGRCGVAYANICKEIMPTEQRGDISNVYPTGWVQAKYDGEYLYNRCHLIGHQLAGEDSNELNLITGTRYFNVSGMLPFENKVAEYIRENTKNHVLYRVTPIYEGNNLVASGVEIEAYSVEDKGKGICFNVYIYNVKPGISIDYKTGKSSENK